MHPNTEPVEGFVCDGEVYCADCLLDTDFDARELPEICMLYEGESDSPTHCGGCGVPIIHDLTLEGAEYVRRALKEGNGCCVKLWSVVWVNYL